ncbi:MAG: Fic family protein [Myxococcales bacterium]|nr:Fic family protein [Myxococcales bacterium]MCB9703504.1 Fic family protein [Myxococcales bacterium]
MQSRTRNYRQIHEASELLWEKLGMLSPSQRQSFEEKLMMSWIHHDFALEGTVLTVAEIKAAIDDEIISSSSLIPAYDHIIAVAEGIHHILDSRGQRVTLSLEWLKKLYQLLLPAGKKDQVQYRKDNPIHRMYFHDLAAADKISYRMRKLTDWFRTDECRKAHPIELATEVHRELIRIFPWPDISGRVARLVMNAILVNEDYWPAIIHAVDRQSYYDVLRLDQDQLLNLVVDAIEEGIRSANRLYQQIVDASRGF